MNSVFAIAQRELKSYFASPVAYVVTALFLVQMFRVCRVGRAV